MLAHLKMTKCQITCKSPQKSSKCQNFQRVIFRADQSKKPPCKFDFSQEWDSKCVPRLPPTTMPNYVGYTRTIFLQIEIPSISSNIISEKIQCQSFRNSYMQVYMYFIVKSKKYTTGWSVRWKLRHFWPAGRISLLWLFQGPLPLAPGYIFFGEVVAVRMEEVLGVIVLYSLSKEFFFQRPGRKCHHLSSCFRSRANGVNIVFNKK